MMAGDVWEVVEVVEAAGGVVRGRGSWCDGGSRERERDSYHVKTMEHIITPQEVRLVVVRLGKPRGFGEVSPARLLSFRKSPHKAGRRKEAADEMREGRTVWTALALSAVFPRSHRAGSAPSPAGGSVRRGGGGGGADSLATPSKHRHHTSDRRAAVLPTSFSVGPWCRVACAALARVHQTRSS